MPIKRLRRAICNARAIAHVCLVALTLTSGSAQAESIDAEPKYDAVKVGWQACFNGCEYQATPELACYFHAIRRASLSSTKKYTALLHFPSSSKNGGLAGDCYTEWGYRYAGLTPVCYTMASVPAGYQTWTGPTYQSGGYTWYVNEGACRNTTAIYACPTKGGWSLQGAQCVRQDCNPNETRDLGTGTCEANAPDCHALYGPKFELEDGICKPQCDAAIGEIRDDDTNQCVPKNADKQQGDVPGELCTGNPINIGTGTKHEALTIYQGEGVLPLTYRLNYTSRLASDAYRPAGGGHGPLWSSNLGRRISVASNPAVSGETTLLARRPDGRGIVFTRGQSGYLFHADGDVNERLKPLAAGYTIQNTDDQTETYDADGRLVSIADPNGNTQTFGYDAAGRLLTVTDPFGRTLGFTYDSAGRIETLTQPDGGIVRFAYATGQLTGITWPDGTSRSFHYEDSRFPDALTGITDELGSRYASWTYDETGRAISSEHAGGTDRVDVAYGAGQSTVTDALGAVRTTNLTNVLGVVRGTGADQPAGAGCGPASSSQTYDARGNVATRTDFNGTTTTYTYDFLNQETQRIEASGSSAVRYITTEWLYAYRKPKRIAEPLQRTTYNYDGKGNVTLRSVQETTDALGSLEFYSSTINGKPVLVGSPRNWTYTYDARGRVLTEDGPLSGTTDKTTYAYYPDSDPDLARRGRLATITNALGHVTRVEWDANGRLIAITDPNGTRTDITRDARGRVLSQSTAGETTSYQYDAAGQLLSITRPDGSATHYGYDAAHRLESVADALGNRITIARDLAGNPTTVALTDAQGNALGTQTYAYDQLGRLASHTGAAGQLAQYALDAMGNPIADTDPLGQVTLYGVDARGRRTDRFDPAGGNTRYAYNWRDQLTKVTDPRGLITQYQYNGFDEQTKLVSPDTGTTTFTYDMAGRETQRTDAKGQNTYRYYDLLNRPTQVIFHNYDAVNYLWDAGTGAKGRLARLTRKAPGATGTIYDQIDFAWDAQGRLIGQVNTVGTHTATTGYAYTNGLLSSLTLPSGRMLNYTHDANGRISAINLTETTGSRALASNVSYRPFGGLTGFVSGANQAMSRQYDGDGRTIAYSLGASPWTLQLDPAARITGQTEQSSQRSGSYAYDALDRITGALLPTASYGYAWDATGNRTERSSGTDAVPYVTEATSNRLTSIGGAFPKTFTYDANGSRTSDGSTNFAYDVRGRLSSVTNAGGTTTYQVNSLGQRVKKTKGATTTYFHYDQQGHLIAEANGSGAIVREYVWLADTPIAVLDGAEGNTTVSWLFADHLNTPRIATNDAGTVIWRMDPLVEPFGDAIPEQDPDGNGTAFVLNLRFPGQYFDAETGLHYNYFRDYDPATGRYVQSDPIGLAGGINTYLYVDGDPLRFVDPDGLRRTKPAPIPGEFGRYPHVPDYWRRDPGKEYRDGHYASVCARNSCPVETPKGTCTPEDPSGVGRSWRTETFFSVPGENSQCVCLEWSLEWRVGRRPPSSKLDKLNILLETLSVGQYQ